jgi:hypothetical protein
MERMTVKDSPEETDIQGGSNMTGTDLCVNKPHKSWSYFNHLVLGTKPSVYTISCADQLSVYTSDQKVNELFK